MLSVSSPAHRYAPFHPRLAELFGLADAALLEALERWSSTSDSDAAGSAVGTRGRVVRRVRVTPGWRSASHAELVWLGAGHHRLVCDRVARVQALVLENCCTGPRGVVHDAGELVDSELALEHPFIVGCEAGCGLALAAELP